MFINMWAVLVAGIAAFVIGGFWYSPMLFGKKWMQLNGMNTGDTVGVEKKSMTTSYVVTFISSLITAFILSKLISWVCTGGVHEAMRLTILAWIAFVGLSSLGMVLWEKKPWALYFINAGYSLVAFVVMGLIIAYWK